MSGCNSGIYSAGRMLYTLGVNGQAPKYLRNFLEMVYLYLVQLA